MHKPHERKNLPDALLNVVGWIGIAQIAYWAWLALNAAVSRGVRLAASAYDYIKEAITGERERLRQILLEDSAIDAETGEVVFPRKRPAPYDVDEIMDRLRQLDEAERQLEDLAIQGQDDKSAPPGAHALYK